MLTEQNIESELSYAYLHAIASRAGFSCSITNRHLDNAGVDAQLDSNDELLAPDSKLASVSLQVQLKATCQEPVMQEGCYSFSLPIKQYNNLRMPRLFIPRILVVLYLPTDRQHWLSHSDDMLVSKRCAYWVSLRGAEPSENPKHQTVYIPCAQRFSPVALTEIMTRISREEEMLHGA